MGVKVAKFGGTSLADANQVKKVMDILLSDSDRKYAVVSAPGKRFNGDDKVTDLLLECHRLACSYESADDILMQVKGRYDDIIDGLHLDMSLEDEFSVIASHLKKGESRHYIASRGEYLSGKVVANALGWSFIDPKDTIVFNSQGMLDEKETYKRLEKALNSVDNAIIPGFYGAINGERIRTFPRGGSDITGSIVTRAINADVYENWTDVSGFLMADPRIVDNPKEIDELTYAELRELSYMGAGVLHSDAVFPLKDAGIPVNIRNTNDPDDLGTTIVKQREQDDGRIITGIAGKKGFTAIAVEKAMMNSQIGFGRRVLSALEDNGLSFEHMPTGIDTLSVIMSDDLSERKLKILLEDINAQVAPDKMEVTSNLALIAVVGRGMVQHTGTAAKIFTSLSKAGINIRMIDQGSSELNIIIGVESDDFNIAIQSIYNAFESGE